MFPALQHVVQEQYILKAAKSIKIKSNSANKKMILRRLLS